MTLGELKSLMAGYSHRSDLTTVIPSFIEQAAQRLNDSLRVREMITSSNVSTNVDSNYAPLPDGYLQMRRVQVEGFAATAIGWHTIAKYQNLSGSLKSYFYAVDGLRIQFAPNGDDTAADLTYYAAVSVPDSDDATNLTLTRYPQLWLQASLMELYDYTDNSKKQQEAMQKFSTDLNAANNASAEGEVGESPQMNGYVENF